MPMRYLNIRSTLPVIGMRIQYNSLDSGIQQPRYEQETQQARSNRGVTQPKLTIDSYPSRHSYGYTNHTDFARENLERGMSEVRKGTSKHTQMAWALAEDGPKQGRQVGIEFAKSDMKKRMTQQRQLGQRGKIRYTCIIGAIDEEDYDKPFRRDRGGRRIHHPFCGGHSRL